LATASFTGRCSNRHPPPHISRACASAHSCACSSPMLRLAVPSSHRTSPVLAQRRHVGRLRPIVLAASLEGSGPSSIEVGCPLVPSCLGRHHLGQLSMQPVLHTFLCTAVRTIHTDTACRYPCMLSFGDTFWYMPSQMTSMAATRAEDGAHPTHTT
jgi:hypothetical protein